MNLYLDYGAMGRSPDLSTIFVDFKTVLFRTPPCPLRKCEQNVNVQIIIAQNELIIASIDFVYLARRIIFLNSIEKKTDFSFQAIGSTGNLCPNCQFNVNNTYTLGIKRPFYVSVMTQLDSADHLVDKMSQLTTEEVK